VPQPTTLLICSHHTVTNAFIITIIISRNLSFYYRVHNSPQNIALTKTYFFRISVTKQDFRTLHYRARMPLPRAKWLSRQVSTVNIRFTVLQSAEVGWSILRRYPHQVVRKLLVGTNTWISVCLSVYLSGTLLSFCWTSVAFSVS
jgi:hypothetical protein